MKDGIITIGDLSAGGKTRRVLIQETINVPSSSEWDEIIKEEHRYWKEIRAEGHMFQTATGTWLDAKTLRPVPLETLHPLDVGGTCHPDGTWELS